MEEPNFWLRDFAKVRFAFLLSLSVGLVGWKLTVAMEL